MKKILSNLLIFFGILYVITPYLHSQQKGYDYFVKGELEPFKSNSELSYKYRGLIQLSNDNIDCSGFVINSMYAVTAAHCLHHNGFIYTQPYDIYTDQGDDPNVTAEAVGYNVTSDLGLLKGDFKDFKPMPVDFENTSYNLKPILAASCGFPWGQDKAVCNPIIINNIFGAHLMAEGHMIHGMSGGPVINMETGVVIGLNTGYAPMFTKLLISPLQGFLGLFNLE